MELIALHGERQEEIHLERGERGYRLRVGEATYEVDAVPAGDGVYSLLIAGEQHEVAVNRRAGGRYEVVTADGESTVEIVDPLTHLARQAHGAAAAGPRRVEAYMPGQVVEILLAEGDRVEPGQGVLVLEAMKMKNEIQAEAPGVLKRILVEEGQAVEGGDPLFEIE